MSQPGTAASPKRKEKHSEIMESITLLEDSIVRLETLCHRAAQGSNQDKEIAAGGITDSLSLGQFLESYPGVIRRSIERCEILYNELEATLF